MADEKKEEKAAPSGLAGATDKLRAVATWMLGAFAAVGAIFAAGVSLANIGKLSTDEPARLSAAVIGIGVTVIAIIVAVAATARVTANSRVSLTLLGTDAMSKLREKVDRDEETLGAYASVAALRSKVRELRTEVMDKNAAYMAAYEALADPATQAVQARRDAAAVTLADATAALQLAQRELTTAESVRADVLDVAAFTRVKDTYDSSKVWIAVAAAAAAFGIALFAWGANPPDTTALDAGAVVPKTPNEVTVLFKDPNPDAGLQAKLGEKCDLSSGVDAVAMTVAGETYQLATVKTGDCKSIWMEVTPEIGVVIPRVDKADAKEEE